MDHTVPTSWWIDFHVLVFVIMALEYAYIRWKGPHRVTHTSIVATILWVGAALGFAGYIFRALGSQSSTEYLASYAIEEALSIDNLFVFLLLFRVFRIESERQPRVLFWGVLGAIVMRGLFIVAGIGLLRHFHWISYIFAAILLIAAIKLVLPEKPEDHEKVPGWLAWISRLRPVSLRQDNFFVHEDGQLMPTVLLLALIAIEVTDLVFAIDSIPAVLSITRHPYIAYTSNIMAVMGLRSLYFLLAHMLERLRFLHYGLAAVLAFAALKMLAASWIEIDPVTSLIVIIAVIGITVALSLLIKKPVPQPQP